MKLITQRPGNVKIAANVGPDRQNGAVTMRHLAHVRSAILCYRATGYQEGNMNPDGVGTCEVNGRARPD